MIYIEVAEKSKKEAIYMTILSTLAANAAMFACEINFNDAEAHAGTSFVPFLGFMVFLIGLVFCFIGIVKINDAKSSGIFSTITVIKMTENSLSMQKRKKQALYLLLLE